MNTLTIMNYSTGEIDVYTLALVDINVWLKEHNYDVDEISYMITDDLKINIHKTT